MHKLIHLLTIIALLSGLLGGDFLFTHAEVVYAQQLLSYDDYVVKLVASDELYKMNHLTPAEVDALKANKSVAFVEQNATYQATLLPNDPDYFRQWYLPHTNMPQAWEYSIGSDEVVIAVLDTGVDVDHPDLSSNIWVNRGETPFDKIDNDGNGFVDDFYGWDFVNNTNDVKPLLNDDPGAVHHGTIVAGVIGARGGNTQGIAGSNWRVKIMALKVLDSNGQGDTFTVTQAINYAVQQGADIINLSFVGTDYSSGLDLAIKNAYQNDVLVVAAAGNGEEEGLDLDVTPAYPVCNDNGDNMVLGVAAVDASNTLLEYSNRGARCIDVVAPGTNYFSTVVNEEQDKRYRGLYSGGWSGTSVAAPVVSGLAGLIKAKNPDLKAVQIRNIINNTAINIDHFNAPELRKKMGNGLIDAGLALKAAAATTGSEVLVSATQEFYIFGAGQTGGPHVRLFDYKGNTLGQWFAYNPSFRGGVRVASGDVDGDGITDIITAPGPGMEPLVRVFDSSGTLKNEWFAYTKNFQGGVYVASGDVDGDGVDEIITGPGAGGGPHVRVFDALGKVEEEFMAYAEHFYGGISVAVGDVASSPAQEIITGPGAGGGPHVRVFTANGTVLSQFMAYAESFRGGIEVAVGDVDSNARAELVTVPASNGGPHVRVFTANGQIKTQWFAGDRALRSGWHVAIGDYNGDGFSQIAIGNGKGAAPVVDTYDWLGNKQREQEVYTSAFRGGVFVGTLY